MLKWLVSAAKSVASYAAPGVGPAVKFGPWIALAAVGAFAWVEHAQIAEARAQVLAAQLQTDTAVQKCQAEAATEAAQESAKAVLQEQAAQATANAATQQLAKARAAAQIAQQAADDASQAEALRITTEAAQTGRDGAIPPVLAEMFP